MKTITNVVKLFVCLCFFSGVSICSYAGTVATVTLTVEQSFVDLDGAPYPSEAEVTYILSAGTPDSPLPSGSEGRQYSFSIKGNGAGTTAPIHFKHAGIFNYELKASIPDPFPYQWSPQVFYIEVYVSNDGSSLIVITNQDQVKVAAMSAVYVSQTRRPNNNGNDNGNSGGGGSNPPTIPTIAPETPVQSEEVPSSGGQMPWFDPELSKTGDSSHMIIWIVLCIISLMGMIILYVKKRK